MRMQGDANDIATVLEHVYKCFRQVDETEHKKTEAQLIAQQVCFFRLAAFLSRDATPKI